VCSSDLNINSDRGTKVNPYIKSAISEQSRETRTGRNGLPDEIGNINSKGMEGHAQYEYTEGNKDSARRDGQTNWLRNWIEVASELCRSNARVPHRMDRIKGLGNSVNPYVVFQIFKVIEQYELTTRNIL
jgi:hypothetical protein